MNILQNKRLSKWLNRIIRLYLHRRMHKLQYIIDNPILTQNKVLKSLIENAKNTEWGVKYNYKNLHTAEAFSNHVPINQYDDLFPYIDRMMHGESDVLWFDKCKWYAKSSGTTSDKSKFIPTTPAIIKQTHTRGSWDVVTILYDRFPDSKIFKNKNLVLCGSIDTFEPFPETSFGDVSGIMLYHMPKIGRPFYAPDFETALMSNWDEKIEKIALIASKENISMFGGVPSWTLLILRRILEITGKSHMLEVWPNADVFIHGGVNFEPYRSQFEQLFPSDNFTYMETYNASEGYFGIQNDFDSDDMLLLLNNGVYYEFIDMSTYYEDNKYAIPLSEVELDKNYAMVISTVSGLWRYVIGDTVKFTSIKPYKFKITGRTKHYINVFGEEVMVSNTDEAVSMTCKELNCQITEYTVGPVFIAEGIKGGHEWVIEFDKSPDDIEIFSHKLDLNLQSVNSDYEAKRFKNMAMDTLKVNTVSKGSFYETMRENNKFGGQNKVPRLSNERTYIEAILNLNTKVGI